MTSYFSFTENACALNLLKYDSQCFLITGHTHIKLTHFNCLVGWHFSLHGFRNGPCNCRAPPAVSRPPRISAAPRAPGSQGPWLGFSAPHTRRLIPWVPRKCMTDVWLLATPWTAAHQAPPSQGFSRQEYWSGLPLPSPLHRLTGLNFLICKMVMIQIS